MITLAVAVASLAVGVMIGIVTSHYMTQREVTRAADERARRRALLGLGDRPARRPSAVGTARVHQADFRETKNWEADGR